jgi:hypothetical protein
MNKHVEQIKTHFQENKKVYVAGGVCLVVGIVATLLVSRQAPTTQIINTISPVFNNNNANVVTLGGYAHKIVKCNETGEIWETVTSAAKAVGVDVGKMSKHLNGHKPHVNGSTYSIIGL